MKTLEELARMADTLPTDAPMGLTWREYHSFSPDSRYPPVLMGRRVVIIPADWNVPDDQSR